LGEVVDYAGSHVGGESKGQWIRVRKGVYKGDLGFVTDVEAWGAKVLVVPRLKTPTPQADISLKRKRTAIKPEPRLFDPATFSSVFQRQPKLHTMEPTPLADSFSTMDCSS
jgi:hypothetical protein